VWAADTGEALRQLTAQQVGPMLTTRTPLGRYWVVTGAAGGERAEAEGDEGPAYSLSGATSPTAGQDKGYRLEVWEPEEGVLLYAVGGGVARPTHVHAYLSGDDRYRFTAAFEDGGVSPLVEAISW
jgi:hypothetical protein